MASYSHAPRSIGDIGLFVLYPPGDADPIQVELCSGDVVLFGGASRLIKHEVKAILEVCARDGATHICGQAVHGGTFDGHLANISLFTRSSRPDARAGGHWRRRSAPRWPTDGAGAPQRDAPDEVRLDGT